MRRARVVEIGKGCIYGRMSSFPSLVLDSCNFSLQRISRSTMLEVYINKVSTIHDPEIPEASSPTADSMRHELRLVVSLAGFRYTDHIPGLDVGALDNASLP